MEKIFCSLRNLFLHVNTSQVKMMQSCEHLEIPTMSLDFLPSEIHNLFSRTPCYKIITEFEEIRDVTAGDLMIILADRLDTDYYTLNIICSILRIHLLGENYRKITCFLSRNRVVGLNPSGETTVITQFLNVTGDFVNFSQGRFLDQNGSSLLVHSPRGHIHSINGISYLILRSDFALLGKKFP